MKPSPTRPASFAASGPEAATWIGTGVSGRFWSVHAITSRDALIAPNGASLNELVSNAAAKVPPGLTSYAPVSPSSAPPPTLMNPPVIAPAPSKSISPLRPGPA